MKDNNLTGYLECLDYLFKCHKFKTNFSHIEILKKMLNKQSNFKKFLDQLEISYLSSNKIEKTPCITEINGNPVVILDKENTSLNVWESRSGNLKTINIDDENKREYINITNLTDTQIKMFTLNSIVSNRLKKLFQPVKISLLYFIISLIFEISIYVISFLVYVIFDYYYLLGNREKIIDTTLIILVILILIYLLEKIKGKLVSSMSIFKEYIYQSYSIDYKVLDSFSVIISIIVMIICIIYYNYNIGLYTLCFIFCIVMMNIGISSVFLNKKDERKIYRVMQNLSYVVCCLYLLGFLNLLIYSTMNNSIGFSLAMCLSLLYLNLSYKLLKVPNHIETIHNCIFDIDRKYFENTLFIKENQLKDIISDIDIKINQMNGNNIENVITVLKGECILVLGAPNTGKTLLSKLMIGKVNSNRYTIYLNNHMINTIPSEMLKNMINVINNEVINKIGKSDLLFINNSIDSLSSDEKNVLKNLGIDKLLKKLEKENSNLSDTEKFNISCVQSIISNINILVIDNVLSRFNTKIIDNILSLFKRFELVIIILEQKDINSKYINKIYRLKE